ncbi:hypothetical protein, partial [Pseudomonas sp. CGJS7]|uniref:hypothetical protein n=1 Tax=Pseudomonas sp. CGJS7 TaxID=3109348 RepID=UPI00300A66D0
MNELPASWHFFADRAVPSQTSKPPKNIAPFEKGGWRRLGTKSNETICAGGFASGESKSKSPLPPFS